MSTLLTSINLGAIVGWNYANVVAGLASNPQANSNFQFNPAQFTNGTGAGQVDTILVKGGTNVTIAASGTATFTLSSFTDFFGNAVAMARFKYVWIALPAIGAPGGPPAGGVQASAITVGGGTHPATGGLPGSGTINIRQGGKFENHAGTDATGWAIVAATSDVITLTNLDSTNAATYQLVVMGCSV